MQVLHTFLYAFPKMLTRRICHTHNQGRLGFTIISFILITFMFDSGVIMLGEIRCQSLLRAKGFSLDLGACFLSHIQNQGYIQNSLFFCFSGLLESYRFCSKFKDFQSIMFRKIQLTAKIRLRPWVIYSFKWYFARCVFMSCFWPLLYRIKCNTQKIFNVIIVCSKKKYVCAEEPLTSPSK